MLNKRFTAKLRKAANEVLRDLQIPQRIGLLLQGEGLLNDATALLIYRAAVTVAAGSFSLVGGAPILVLAAVGSLAAGYVLARLYLIASAFVRDPASTIVLQFVSTFGVWLLSERLTFSPIITVVIYAFPVLAGIALPFSDCTQVRAYSDYRPVPELPAWRLTSIQPGCRYCAHLHLCSRGYSFQRPL